MDEKLIKSYDVEKVNKKLMNYIREEGKLEGIEKEKINIARNLLKENINTNIISNTTGLSINQINSIKF